MTKTMFRPHSRTSLAALALGIGCISSPAAAQDASVAPAAEASTAAPPEDSAKIGEIVVTAQRREQNLQKVPIAIAAVTGETLRTQGLTRSTDIVRLTPGVSISASSAGENAQYTMRGVTQNDYAEIAEGPIAVYVDDSYIPNLQGANFGFYDLQRVEVLKGPQGILFGRNATGGLVQYIIEKPTDHLSGYANATYGSYDNTRFEGAISGPISDTLSARASFLYDRNGAYWKNMASPSDSATPIADCCHDLGGKRNIGGRIQLEWKPTSDFTARFMGSINRQRYSAAAYSQKGSATVTDADGHVIDTVFTPTDAFGFTAPSIKDREISVDMAKKNLDFSYSNDANLHLDYDMGNIHLVSITSYRRFWKKTFFDADASPLNFLNFGSKGHSTNWSEELRLQGTTDKLTWNAGLYLLDIKGHFNVGLTGPVGSLYASLFGAEDTGIDTVNDAQLHSQSGSVFGQLEYKVAPTLTVIAGLRGILEHQSFQYGAFAYSNLDPYQITTNPDEYLYSFNQDYRDKRTEKLWSGKIQLQWEPTSHLMAYAGINRGTKGGNYNVLLAGNDLSSIGVPYGPETLIAYEIGAKWTFWDGKARFNAATYYYDYKNYQAYSSRGLTTYVLNRPARNYGVEGSLTLKPVRNLQIDMSGSLLSAKVKNVTVSTGLDPRDVDTPFAPKQQASAVVSYTLPGAVASGDLTLSGNYYYTAGFYTNNQNFSNQRIPGYSLFGATVRWEDANRRWSVAFTANNIFDKRYATTFVDLTSVCGCTEAAYGTPRWLTGTIGYRF
jgi:iron complex outermembrane receptor protein